MYIPMYIYRERETDGQTEAVDLNVFTDIWMHNQKSLEVISLKDKVKLTNFT